MSSFDLKLIQNKVQKSFYWVRQATYDQNVITQKTFARESEKWRHERKSS